MYVYQIHDADPFTRKKRLWRLIQIFKGKKKTLDNLNLLRIISQYIHDVRNIFANSKRPVNKHLIEFALVISGHIIVSI